MVPSAKVTDPFEGGGYPALQEAADQASGRAQAQFLWALRLRLVGLLSATAGVAVLTTEQTHTIGALIALGGFVLAVLCEAYSTATNPEREWYEGRAAAESVKTLSWRYAVRGEGFGDISDLNADKIFVTRVLDVLHDLRNLTIAEDTQSGSQITSLMRDSRSSSFDARRESYRVGRIGHQRQWYARNAKANRSAYHRWTIGVFVCEGVGVIGGVVSLVTALHVDVLGLAAALAASVTAWLQAKQHRTLATAYGVTAQELAGVEAELASLCDEGQWARFVGQAEEAISREHTLWRASRGVMLR